MIKPLEVISAIRKSFIGSEQVYTNGSCVMFYFILKTIFKSAKPYWNIEARHMITRIGNKYYDINGLVSNTKGYELDKREFTSYPIAVAFPQRGERRIRVANFEKMF
jgi:hypothetical protein